MSRDPGKWQRLILKSIKETDEWLFLEDLAGGEHHLSTTIRATDTHPVCEPHVTLKCGRPW